MSVNWRGKGTVEENVLFLVDLKNSKFKKVKSRLNKEEKVENALIPFCKIFEDKLKEGSYLFTADLLEDGYYEATNRATYAEWMDNPFPYYIDCAENNEMVLFHNIVNN